MSVAPQISGEHGADAKRCHLAVIRLLRLLSSLRAADRFDGGQCFVSIDQMGVITQTSFNEVSATVRLLDEAGMLAKSENASSPGYAIKDYGLLKDFEKFSWKGSAEVLATTYDAGGEFVHTGYCGQGWGLEREGYIETRQNQGYDTQFSRITAKGRAAYAVLNVLCPRDVNVAAGVTKVTVASIVEK